MPHWKHYYITGVVWTVLLLNVSSGFTLKPQLCKCNHLPVEINFTGIAYVYTEADILFDPTLLLDDVEMKMQNWAGK